MRKAEGTSLNKATVFNKNEVALFSKLLTKLMKKILVSAYNVDVTGISSVENPGKIVTETRQKRCGFRTKRERGETVRIVRAVNATRVYVPPILINQSDSTALEGDRPRGAVNRYSKNGWINENLFVDWLKIFADFSKRKLTYTANSRHSFQLQESIRTFQNQ